MTKEEITELENKIAELKKEVELWKKFRELEDEVERLKNKPITVIPYQPIHIPTYPAYPWWEGHRWTTCGDKFYVNYESGLRTTSGG